MPNLKATPGPWKLNGECFTASGHYDAPRVFSHADPDNPRFIAEIAVGNLWEENGNLTAASPCMYEALRDALPYLTGEVRDHAVSALAQADGIGVASCNGVQP